MLQISYRGSKVISTFVSGLGNVEFNTLYTYLWDIAQLLQLFSYFVLQCFDNLSQRLICSHTFMWNSECDYNMTCVYRGCYLVYKTLVL